MRFEINVKKDIEMAEIIGTVTSIKRYLSPEKIELKISPDMGAENTITLPQNRKYSNQVTLVYDFFQRILLDKEIVPKILVLKYILEFYDGEEHQKREYDSFHYS